MSRLLSACIVLCGLLLPSLPALTPVANADSCSFVLGFAAIANAIPEIVGQCLENEQHNPANGDGLQHTTKGLLVWRKADNFTAFTDGYRTWVNGPYGIFGRLNTQRYSWESNPEGLPAAEISPIDRCHTSQLVTTVVGGQGAAGHIAFAVQFRSTSSKPCFLQGFPGAQVLDDAQQPAPIATVWANQSMMWQFQQVTYVVLAPGGVAYAIVGYSDVPTGNSGCQTYHQMYITPPNSYTPVLLHVDLTPCNQIQVSPVESFDSLL